MTSNEIMDIIREIKDPRNGKNLADETEIQGISNTEGLLKVRLSIKDLQPDEKKQVRSLIEEAFEKKGVDVLISITSESSIQPKPPANPQLRQFLPEGTLDRFKKIIAVYSTKGGVGKSTVAANLALELAGDGFKIAVVDLDIYGPSIPRLLGLKGEAVIHEKSFVPAELPNIHMMSVGLLVPQVDAPLIWRAPVVNGVISQIFTDTLWDSEYDVLVLDMPPGTGDIPILVGQSIPPDGIVVVSTPQGVALEDTIKGVSMFNKYNVPIFGFVYNMGSVVHDGALIPIFKHNGEFDELMTEHGVDIIAELPLDPKLAELADKGELHEMSKGLWKDEFKKITNRVVKELELRK